ncbi:MAG: hypothetical protein H0V77_10255, partial [Actinobacteria bacterium]|nr:hypothetical protein [Actinomycetota bacterium]
VRSDAISVAVVGVGGVRGFFGGTLSRSGEDVVFVGALQLLKRSESEDCESTASAEIS